MRILITRHGETEENLLKIADGHLPGTLTENGKSQAQRLAERLKDEKIDTIVSSDLSRALDTAKIISRFHPETKILTDRRLREASVGKFQGMKNDEVDWNSSEIESREDMEKRVYSLVLELFEKHADKTILLVGHAWISKVLIGKLKGLSDESFCELKQKNTCLNIFEIDKDANAKEILLNCTRHLDED